MKKDISKNEEESTFKVEDRRHAYLEDEEPEATAAAAPEPAPDPNLERAEKAETKLREYMEAFRAHQAETERAHERLRRDIDRRVDLEFGNLLGRLLATVDDLDLALAHVGDVPEAAALAEGVSMTRSRFLATLEECGVERIAPDRAIFDPNVAEALRVDPVDSEELDGCVTETLQPGYRFKERVIRAARVAVGRFAGTPSAPASED